MSKFLVGLLTGCLGVLVVTATLSSIDAATTPHKTAQGLPEGAAIGTVGTATLSVFNDNEAGSTCYTLLTGGSKVRGFSCVPMHPK